MTTLIVDVQIVFSGVLLLTPGKEAYRLKSYQKHEDQGLPLSSSPSLDTEYSL